MVISKEQVERKNPSESFQETLPSLHKRGSVRGIVDRPEARALASVARHVSEIQILARGNSGRMKISLQSSDLCFGNISSLHQIPGQDALILTQ